MFKFTFRLLFTLIILFSANMGFAQDVGKIPFEKMEKFEHMLGHWDVVNYNYEDGDWKEVGTARHHYFKKLKGMMVGEDVSNVAPDGGLVVESTITYDQYRNLYRLAAIDDTYGLMDIYEGDFVSDKVFQVTNLRAGTNFPTSDGGLLYFRLTFTEVDENAREFLVEQSADAGENWGPMMLYKLTRVD